ncbi:hypothetical protein HMPREF3091_17305 [Hafnia sp. HMSC23F03]|nr:hypothetical protein HMPREF3091_17305 [Hafnia sp. HMSC23F03]
MKGIVMNTKRIGGWLVAPLAYMIVSLLSSSLMMIIFVMMVVQPASRSQLFSHSPVFSSQWTLSFVITIAIWAFTLFNLYLFGKRSRRFPKFFVLWLLVMVLLAIRTFAFSPVTDAAAVRNMVIPLLAAAVFVPYIKRSRRVRDTFIEQ